MMGFSETLATLRTGQRLSQTKLAVRAGLDRSYVSRLESGARTPTVDAVDRLAVALSAQPTEHDALRLSAGFVPTLVVVLADPVVRDLNDLLEDESVNVVDRESVREMVTILVRSARRRNAPRYETYPAAQSVNGREAAQDRRSEEFGA
jgi:transcriptional regulator with XRE-family HTH domain